MYSKLEAPSLLFLLSMVELIFAKKIHSCINVNWLPAAIDEHLHPLPINFLRHHPRMVRLHPHSHLRLGCQPRHSGKEEQMIHKACFKTGISSELNVSNSLITMYARLGSMEESGKVFYGMGFREIISWKALITGYAQNGFCEEALDVFSSSVLHAKPNEYTFGSILSVITATESVSLAYGLICHCITIKLGLNTREYVSGALTDMYAKCGSIHESRIVFDETSERSLVSWTAIISAYAKHGMFEVVMKMYGDMVSSAVRPDHVTFLAVLTACGCKGMVDSGRSVFESMVSEYKIDPWPEHCACMVDMLGRGDRLVEAEEFVNKIPIGPGWWCSYLLRPSLHRLMLLLLSPESGVSHQRRMREWRAARETNQVPWRVMF